jgi:tetratricopeptide (TPR) repeat protein
MLRWCNSLSFCLRSFAGTGPARRQILRVLKALGRIVAANPRAGACLDPALVLSWQPIMRTKNYLGWAFLSLLCSGCSAFSSPPALRPALAANGCKPSVVSQNNQAGMALYSERHFEAAKAKFSEAVAQGPKCAEAHYNLGLALKYLGAKEEAREHFLEAANLAPGNQIIWDSPALRPYGEPQKEKKNAKVATEQAPGAFGNRSRNVGGY